MTEKSDATNREDLTTGADTDAANNRRGSRRDPLTDMRKYIVLTSSLFLVLMGTMIEDRGLAMHIAEDGMVIYPLSSGSEAGLILKLGLHLFAVTACYSLVSITRTHRDVTLFIVYSVNSLIYALCLFIVMLDSSIIGAAKLGDWLPLAANIILILSFVIYGAFSLKKYRQPDAGRQRG